MNQLSTAVSFLFALAAASASGQSPEPAPAPVAAVSLASSLRSLVSEQLWSDVLVHGAWRLQRHELKNRFRILDPGDNERYAGGEDPCRTEFARLKRNNTISALSGPAVITLHGFGRSREHMTPLGARLAESGKYTWVNVNYASTRGGIDQHAATLASVIAGLEGIDEIHFVCHSLGNLVVRRYLFEATTTEPRWQTDTRIRRMVMLGPPNQGAQAAKLITDILHESPLARLITGPSAWQLARHWDEAEKQLATPHFEFGILAGGFADGRGFNPLVAGDDDLVVRVAETHLAGAADFRLVPCRHGGMMRDPVIQQYALHFLREGCFTSCAEKQPLPAADPAQANE